MNGTPHLSKDSYAVTTSSTERLCEWRGLNCCNSHAPKQAAMLAKGRLFGRT